MATALVLFSVLTLCSNHSWQTSSAHSLQLCRSLSFSHRKHLLQQSQQEQKIFLNISLLTPFCRPHKLRVLTVPRQPGRKIILIIELLQLFHAASSTQTENYLCNKPDHQTCTVRFYLLFFFFFTFLPVLPLIDTWFIKNLGFTVSRAWQKFAATTQDQQSSFTFWSFYADWSYSQTAKTSLVELSQLHDLRNKNVFTSFYK